MARDFLRHAPRSLFDLSVVILIIAFALLPWAAAVAIGLVVAKACHA